MSTVREWLVIESSRMNDVLGYIPRDAAEGLLGRPLDGFQTFTQEEKKLMQAHPEWRGSLS